MIPPATTGSLKIKLTSDEPVCYQPYRLAPTEKHKLKTIVNKFIATNIVHESYSRGIASQIERVDCEKFNSQLMRQFIELLKLHHSKI